MLSGCWWLWCVVNVLLAANDGIELEDGFDEDDEVVRITCAWKLQPIIPP